MKLLIILMFSGLWSIDCLGQKDSSIAQSDDSAKNKSTLTFGAVYCNNADYYGQKAEENIPYIALATTYRFGSGIYFSGLAYRLLKDSGRIVSAGNLGVGYDFKLSKKWTAGISYSHTFYPSYSPLLQAANPDNASASLTYESFLSSKINVDYAFGKATDLFVTAGTGKQISIGHITSKDIITINPTIDVTAGTQHFYQTYLTEKRLEDSLLGILLTPITGNPPSQSSTTQMTTQFNVLSYNFKCPVAYSRSGYMLEINYQLSLLSDKAQSGAGNKNSFFSASFYYQF
ncbi:MAG TPA: hypothetical protein VNV85_05265 [Puia sp.]|jgi:hypothetical protein|nr:hypothetical protein [Puia sp.]